jgi:hypothetical protein
MFVMLNQRRKSLSRSYFTALPSHLIFNIASSSYKLQFGDRNCEKIFKK